MNILGFDTALDHCSIAIQTSMGDLFLDHQEQPRGHAEVLIPRIEDLLDKAGLSFHDLDLLATTIGPGSFTGLRVGMSAAQGYALSTGRPLIGCTTLEMLAHSIDNQGQRTVAMIDSKRGDYYVQVFDELFVPLTQPFIAQPEELSEKIIEKKFILIGSCVQQVLPYLQDRDLTVMNQSADASTLLKLAQERFQSGENQGHPNDLSPLYLRQADAIAPKKQSVQMLND